MTGAIAHAATVLLLRESEAGLQVLMTKRAPGLSFMAGLWVFPGGRMEPSDLAPDLAARADQIALTDTASRMLDVYGEPLDIATARGLLVGACRETFEEAGVLLALPCDDRGDLGADRLARVASRRVAASADATEFARLLRDENLVLDIDHLVYWSHWITPGFETKRFDTRFFALQVPQDQEASVDYGELTHHAWLTENDVRTHTASAEMKLAPPTRATLLDLWNAHRRHGSLVAMLAAERTRVVPPILPKWIELEANEMELVLPWDAAYGEIDRESCVVLPSYPQYMREMPSRIRFTRRT